MIAAAMMFLAAAMAVPAIFAFVNDETDAAVAFAALAVICAAILGISFLAILNLKWQQPVRLKKRNSYLILLVTVLIVLVVSALPWYMSGNDFTLVDCWFESVSGWTTTGASVLNQAIMPHSLILWKAICSWAGGLILIILAVTVFPRLGIISEVISDDPRTENAGMVSPRTKDAMKLALAIYAVLTVLGFLVILPSGCGIFPSVIFSLSCVSTTGTVEYHAAFPITVTAYLRIVTALLAFLASFNYFFYFNLAERKIKKALREYEVRQYLILIAASIYMVGLLLFLQIGGSDVMGLLTNAIVYVLSFASSTGFAFRADADIPSASAIVLLVCGIIGGCSISSSSGLKIGRVVTSIKLVIRGIYKRIHPSAVKPVTVGKRTLSPDKSSFIAAYIMLFFLVFIAGLVLMSIENQDMSTTLTSTICAYTNCGSFFGKMNTADFSIFSVYGRIVSSILMIIGRLEIYPVIMLLSRSFWNPERSR